MKKLTIIDNEDVSLYCYPKKGIIHHVTHNFIYGETYRNLMTKGADIFIEKNCNKWLSNVKSSSVVKKEDIQWEKENWEKRVLSAGWKYWAIVESKNRTGRLSIQQIIEHYKNQGVQVRKDFQNDIAGLYWLSKQS